MSCYMYPWYLGTCTEYMSTYPPLSDRAQWKWWYKDEYPDLL